MDSIGQELGSTLDLKHLLEVITPSESRSNMGKPDPLIANDLPDFGLAYLGPQLWSDTMMSDDLKLEPINLDDLLVENTLSSELTEIQSLLSPEQTQSSPRKDIAGNSKEPDKVPNGNQNFAMLDNVYHSVSVNFDQTYNTAKTLSIPTILPKPVQNQMPSPSDLQQAPTSPAEEQQQNFEYEPDITDVMISTPLEEVEEGTPRLFDPRNRAFSEEELKPQPIIRKAKKVYVPDESKDAKYWQKREKNNVAAKRSRAARRIKENQIAMRTTFLEKENDNLRSELKDVRSELQRLMKVVKGYEARKANN